MTGQNGIKRQRVNRIALVARVQLAYEQVTDAMERMRMGAPHARAALAMAKRRFNLLNRALAMMALQNTVAAA